MAENNKEHKNREWIWIAAMLTIAVAGFYIFKKTHLISGDRDYYAYYSNIKGLQASSPIQLNGVTVGKITDIELNDKGAVKVKLTIHGDLELLEGTTAKLASGGITGDKLIKLTPGPGPGILPENSDLRTDYDTSVMQMSVRTASYVETAKYLLRSMDSTLRLYNALVKTHVITGTATMLINMEQSMDHFAEVSDKLHLKGDTIISKLPGWDSATIRIAAKNGKVNQQIRDVESNTTKLAGKSLADNIKSIQASASSMKNAITQLSGHKMISSDASYHGFTGNLDTMNQGMQETYKHPKGFSVFGGKKKKKSR